MFGRKKISQEEIERLKNKINIDNGFFCRNGRPERHV